MLAGKDVTMSISSSYVPYVCYSAQLSYRDDIVWAAAVKSGTEFFKKPKGEFC